jgi:cysteine-rich repeat protein
MRSLVVLLCFGFILGCGDNAVVQPTADVGFIDVVMDTSPAVDTAQPDTAQPDMAQPDMAVEDAGASSTCEPGEGCFGESCAEPDDCLSGICTMHLGDKVCSKTCDEACPQGFSCTLVGSGGDGQYVCMSKFSHLCLPCSDAGTCSGETPNACVQYADGTRFCGGACDLENPCPSGYSCQEVQTADGANSYQCVNTAGVCPCSNLAIDSALATPCEATNDQGSCEGVRICEESGLSACSAVEPSAEVCNGMDDDCNGLTDESTCDDGNSCTVDTCDGEEGCQYEALTGDECLDGDICTVTDHCEDGVCVGTPVECNDDNPCTKDSCNGLGGCAYESIVALCDDGDACTLGDICQEGACTGSTSLTCDDGNPCTDDSCGEAGCVFEANAVGCDDGNACTSTDTCGAGACKGAQVACDDGNLCTTDSCDIGSGCVNANNTQPCDDGDGCTQGDSCTDGACSAGAATTCDDGNLCTDDACDGNLGCIFSPNALDCDDKNSCTTGDSCVEGNCIGLGDLSCDDGNPCTEDACLPDGGCAHTNVVGLCSDGDACTANDTCVDGGCVSGAPISCDDGNPCTDEACEGGDCLFTANASECDDGNACTTGDSCADGACKAAGALGCDDGNTCTNDGCDPSTGCTHTPHELPCSDGDLCTINDQCNEGVCLGGGILACDDSVFCNGAEACDPNTGCKPGNPPNVDDGVDCTVDACDEEADVVFHTPVSEECDDDLFCNGVETCDPAGGCQDGAAPVIDDGIPCTLDTCDEAADTVVHTAVNEVCDDGAFCNGTESCDAAQGCLAGESPVVADGVGCTDDICDEENDVVTHTPDNAKCDLNGLCQVGICDPGQGCVSETVVNCCGNGAVEGAEECDDGNANNNDGCSANCEQELAPECFNYSSLTDASRHHQKGGGVVCDSNLNGWYRFEGEAGTKMLESCPSQNSCGTHAPGWMQGGHPSVEQGQVSRTVCYHWDNGCCHWSQPVAVRNCGAYYVYQLNPTVACHLRYCGSN